MDITSKQLKLARVQVEWTQAEASKFSGVTTTTIQNLEQNNHTPHADTFKKLVSAYRKAGVEFIPGGIREARSIVERHTGKEGLEFLMDDVYTFASEIGGDIRLYNAKPQNWLDYITVEWFKAHAMRMVKVIDNFDMRILAEENNSKLISSYYAIHRWFPKEFDVSGNESLYMYGSKLAFVEFKDNDVEINILESAQFSKSCRALFEIAWDNVGILPDFGEKLSEVDFSEWEEK